MRDVLGEEALQAWGRRIGTAARTPLVLCLRGDLGAGKSTLARAIAHGAGVEGDVPSPTFNLVFRYDTPRARVWHLDLYRLERDDEVWELGWGDLGADGDLVMIEWPERAEALLPPVRWEIELLEDEPDARVVTASPVGEPPPLPPMRGAA
jgi:tRNA threonylcarbamoyl adenosine modification protein YjeE